MLCFSFAVIAIRLPQSTSTGLKRNWTNIKVCTVFNCRPLLLCSPGTVTCIILILIQSRSWKPLTSLAPPADTTSVYRVETVGSKIFVAGSIKDNCNGYIYWYDLEKNVWEKHSQSNGELSHLCTVGDYIYAFNSDCTQIPQRYSFSERQWQSFAKVTVPSGVIFFNGGTAVLHSKVFVLYGGKRWDGSRSWAVQYAVLLCLDPAKNMWEEKASTPAILILSPHSSLFVVNGKLNVAGGTVDILPNGSLQGNRAPVEVYDQDNNNWSVVEQKRIPENNLGAVEVEGRVYFIINKFPIDSGVRIPPGEVYPFSLSGKN